MRIILNNVSSQLVIGGKDNLLPFDLFKELDNYLKIRPNGYQHVQSFRRHQWDGYRHFLSSKGVVATGFIPLIILFCMDNNVRIDVDDERMNIPKFKPEAEREWGLGEWDARENQQRAVNSFDNYIDYGEGRKIYFPRGVGDLATNFGKNSVIAALVKNTIGSRFLLTIHREEIFRQLYVYLKKFFTVGRIDSKYYDVEGRIVIAMAGTLYNRLKKSINVKKDMAKFNGLIVDECHRAGGNQYAWTLQNVPAPMRIFLSGTPLDNDDKVANMIIVGLSGPPVIKVSKKEQQDKGYSKKVKVFLHLNPDKRVFGNYDAEYRNIVQLSTQRALLIAEIIQRRPSKKIMITFIERVHGFFIFEAYMNTYGTKGCEIVHGQDKERKAKIARFTSGETRIIFTSEIMQEGINIEDIDVLVYAQGGKEKIAISQFSGRIERDDGKEGHVEIHDFYDYGKWVSKHSTVRKNIYAKEQFEIIYNYEHKRGKPTGQRKIDLSGC